MSLEGSFTEKFNRLDPKTQAKFRAAFEKIKSAEGLDIDLDELMKRLNSSPDDYASEVMGRIKVESVNAANKNAAEELRARTTNTRP